MVVNIYVLHGHWETAETRGATVVYATPSERRAMERLEEIASDNAAEYVSLCTDDLEIEKTGNYLEVRDMSEGGFAGFYIVEMPVHM